MTPVEFAMALFFALLVLVGGVVMVRAFFAPPSPPRNCRVRPQPKQPRVFPRNVRSAR